MTLEGIFCKRRVWKNVLISLHASISQLLKCNKEVIVIVDALSEKGNLIIIRRNE